jgi:CheY-like chemotaxis protein
MSKRILVVEDQPDNRQIIRDMLALGLTVPIIPTRSINVRFWG